MRASLTITLGTPRVQPSFKTQSPAAHKKQTAVMMKMKTAPGKHADIIACRIVDQFVLNVHLSLRSSSP